jgi:hypothetical protein
MKMNMRISMPRKPFNPEKLNEEMTFQEFESWLKDNPRIDAEDSASFNAHTFQYLLKQYASLLGKQYENKEWIDYPIAPSMLPEYGIRMPAAFFLECSMHIVLDEFFGIMYMPDRKAKRFDGDIQKVLMDRIRASKSDPGTFLDSLKSSNFSETAMLRDVEALYGRVAVKTWWYEASEETLEALRLTSVYDELVTKYGGGLEDVAAPATPTV